MRGYVSKVPHYLSCIAKGHAVILGSISEDGTYNVALIENVERLRTQGLEAAKTALTRGPLIVVTPELRRLVARQADKMMRGMVALVEAGELKLPYDELTVELQAVGDESEEDQSNSTFVSLAGPTKDDPKFNVIFSACGESTALFIPLHVRFQPKLDLSTGEKMVDIAIEISPVKESDYELSRHPRMVRLIEVWLSQSLAYACMLWRTKGVAKEEVRPTPASIRLAKMRRKPTPVPYTILHVGQVYDRAGNAHDVDPDKARTMPLHWRMGHWRNQAYGPGRKEHKRIWIDAMLINFEEGDTIPAPKKYLATV